MYLGTVFAPLILFFAVSGALQTLGLHESERGAAPAWIAQIASIHKNQQLQGEEREKADRPPPKGAPPEARKSEAEPKGPSPWPLKWFVVLMSIGLITTTLLGIYMAFKYSRNKLVVWGLLALGTVLPFVLLFL